MKLRLLVGCWLTAWIGAVVLVATIAPRWMRFYGGMGFELRSGAEIVLRAGKLLGSTGGMAGVALALALGLLPLRAERPRWLLLWWFGGGAVVAVVLAVLAWLLLEAPLVFTFWSFGSPNPLPPAVKLRPGGFLSMLVFGPSPLAWLVLAGVGFVWLREAIHVLGRPRTTLAVEALRAAVIASFPALLLGALAFLAGSQGYAPEGALVAPPAVAAAGTIVIVLYGAAVWLRLRRPAPDEVSAPAAPT